MFRSIPGGGLPWSAGPFPSRRRCILSMCWGWACWHHWKWRGGHRYHQRGWRRRLNEGWLRRGGPDGGRRDRRGELGERLGIRRGGWMSGLGPHGDSGAVGVSLRRAYSPEDGLLGEDRGFGHVVRPAPDEDAVDPGAVLLRQDGYVCGDVEGVVPEVPTAGSDPFPVLPGCSFCMYGLLLFLFFEIAGCLIKPEEQDGHPRAEGDRGGEEDHTFG